MVIIAVLCVIGFLWRRYLWFDTSYDAEISLAAEKYDVAKDLIYAVIKAESNFDADAVSAKGAAGLMQIMPDTAAFVAAEMGMQSIDLLDKGQNLEMGVWYLSYLQTKFEDRRAVVAAYNAGESVVSRWLKDGSLDDIPYPETKGYVGKVEFFQKTYKLLYQ